MARRRPSAFEISFPEEAAALQAEEERAASARASSSRHGSTSTAYSRATGGRATPTLKRKSEGPGDVPVAKRQQLPPTAYYLTCRDEKLESEVPALPGEDPEVDDDEQKPIRVITDFSIFDPKHRNELVSLAAIEEDDGVDRQFEGAGWAKHVLDEEDEGQEDGAEDGEDDRPVYLRLGAILRFTVDYTKENEEFYIETLAAWYILRRPSALYQGHYQHFYTPRRIAQLVISSAIRHPQMTKDSFLQRFTHMVDIFGRTYLEEHLWEGVSEIQEAILDAPDLDKIKKVPVIKYLLRSAPASPARHPRHRARQDLPRNRRPPQIRGLTGNADLAVLKSENQTVTHVTPLIASLAEGLVREELVVVGAPPPREDKAVIEAREKRAFLLMWECIKIAKRVKRSIDYRKEDKISPRSDFLTAVEIDQEIYKVGDYVIVPRGDYGKVQAPEMPNSIEEVPELATLDEYFWFAKILYIKHDTQEAHIQWLEHGKQIVLEELAHPQELFLNDLCGHILLQTIISKVKVHERPTGNIDTEDYFVKFMHNKALSTFTSLDTKLIEYARSSPPPENCPVCLLKEQQDQELADEVLSDQNKVRHGVRYGGKKYHLDDFVLYRAEKGPAHIGYIQHIHFPKRSTSNKPTTMTLKKVGRIATLQHVLPPTDVKDERHLYLTDEETTIEVQELVRVVFAFSVTSFESPTAELADWLDLSEDHFYLTYRFPSMEVRSWADRKPVPWKLLRICNSCCVERLQEREAIVKFFDHYRNRQLPTLDLFGGVGAFSRGLADGSQCLQVTHAIEISPSAAKTFQRNSPGTVVYNQCANIMLRYFIKSRAGHVTDPPNQLFNDRQQVPPPPKPGSIKVITAGFPCQSHSTLNMFKDANDPKSNLMLTTLSFMNVEEPDIGYYENVPGYLNFNFNATQSNKYKVEGGIKMGGLKLLLRAHLDMGYQIRYGLLQAGHYGTPQRRVRFIAIAARDGIPLPELPQPSHDFPVVNSLSIKLPTEETIHPIRTTAGTALHPYVSIDDAIGDLPRFDWKHLRPTRESLAKQRERRERAVNIPAFECKPEAAHCGLRGPNFDYHHNPKTSYQVTARASPTTDIQHFTKCLLPKKVERVISIPLAADADYRSLRADQYEWQFANPSSSVAMLNYRPGLYGRLNKDGFFPTTVTNMDPTAKQSRVLNPYCHRMVTVRELARSQGFPDNFVFEAIGGNVVTMHRQIGNAVPLPMAKALGRELRKALFQKWKSNIENMILIDSEDEE